MQHSVGLEMFFFFDFCGWDHLRNKFISLNFTQYMCQLILPKQNIHQIMKLQNFSSVKIFSPTVAKRQDVLNHTLCDMSCILTTRQDKKGACMAAENRPHPLVVSGWPLTARKGM